MTATSALTTLARCNPWPDLSACRGVEPFTFALDGGGRELLTELIRERDIRCMVEVGCFLCGSTRRWLEASDRLVVVGIDPWPDDWDGSIANMLALQPRPAWLQGVDLERYGELVGRYGTHRVALNNLRDHKDRFIPVRRPAPDAYHYLKRAGLKPDLIYIDAMKRRTEFTVAHKLFPDAILAGDDWTWTDRRGRFPVRDHVYDIARRRNAKAVRTSRATWLIVDYPPEPTAHAPAFDATLDGDAPRRHAPGRTVIPLGGLHHQSLGLADDVRPPAGGRLPAGAATLVTKGTLPHQRLISPDMPMGGPAGTIYRIRFRVLPGPGVTTVGIRLTFERSASLFLDAPVAPGRWQTVTATLKAPIGHAGLKLFLYPATTAADADRRPGLESAISKIELSPEPATGNPASPTVAKD